MIETEYKPVFDTNKIQWYVQIILWFPHKKNEDYEPK
jgi:hypothetical protein